MPVTRRLGERFRKERAALEPLVDPGRQVPAALAPGLAILGQRSRRMLEVRLALGRAADSGQLDALVRRLLPSLLHMHANRILRAAARQQEMVLYDFLARLYTSQKARGRRSVNNGSSSAASP